MGRTTAWRSSAGCTNSSAARSATNTSTSLGVSEYSGSNFDPNAWLTDEPLDHTVLYGGCLLERTQVTREGLPSPARQVEGGSLGDQDGIDCNNLVLQPLSHRVVAVMSKGPAAEPTNKSSHRWLMISGCMPSLATLKPIQIRRRPLRAALAVWATVLKRAPPTRPWPASASSASRRPGALPLDPRTVRSRRSPLGRSLMRTFLWYHRSSPRGL